MHSIWYNLYTFMFVYYNKKLDKAEGLLDVVYIRGSREECYNLTFSNPVLLNEIWISTSASPWDSTLNST